MVVGASILCPLAALALGIAYGTLELESAVTGKDWISGHKLGTGERVFRGVLAPLDIVPGVSGLSKFSSTVRLAHMGDMAELGVKTGIKAGIQRKSRHVANMVIDAGKDSAARIRSAKAWAKEVPDRLKKSEDSKILKKSVDEEALVTKEKNIIPDRKMKLTRNEGSISQEKGHTKKEFISQEDKAKIENWKYPPSEEKYLKYKGVYDNPQYYNQETGEVVWPPNDGFSEEPVDTILKEGMLIDRYGEPTGGFFSPAGTPYEQRALALHSDEANYYVYRVLEDFEVKSGKIAPWFGRSGGGIQYIKFHENGSPYTINELIEDGIIELVSVREWKP